MERYQLAIIIPAFNEEQTIKQTIKSVLHYGIVIVIDDGSIDQTKLISLEAGAVVISHSYNQGYDSALNSGFYKASELNCQYAITFDADGQHDSSLIPIFLDKLKNEDDLVIGIRPSLARFSEYIFALYTRIMFGIKDPLCGMKAYRMQLYYSRGCFDSYQSIGTELMLFALYKKFSYSQIKIPINKRQGDSKFGNSFNANMRIFRALILAIKFLSKPEVY